MSPVRVGWTGVTVMVVLGISLTVSHTVPRYSPIPTRSSSNHSHSIAVKNTHFCRSDQLRFQVTSPLNSIAGTTADEIQFTNTGATCTMPSDVPSIQLVRGPHHQRIGAGPVVALYLRYPYPTLQHGQSVYAVLSVIRDHQAASPLCQPVATDGLLIQFGVGMTTRFVRFRIAHVCSNRSIANVSLSHFVLLPR